MPGYPVKSRQDAGLPGEREIIIDTNPYSTNWYKLLIVGELMKRIVLLLTVLMIVTVAFSQEMLREVLPNGMEVVVKKNDMNNSAGVYCFVKTGSSFEEEFMGCGLSHYLEHLVSSGTNKFRTEKEYQEIYKRDGLISNAYTSTNVTAYHLTGEATHVDSMITYISEMVTACGLDQFEVDREKEVILKEIVYRSSPMRAQTRQRGSEIFYPNSPIKNPIIGYVNLFKDVTRDDLVEYYSRHYVPNNMILVVVGNIDVNSTMAHIEKTYKKFERQRYNPVVLTKQPGYEGNHTVIQEFDTESSSVTIKYILPGVTNAEVKALTMALHNIAGPRKAPLSYLLKEEKKLVQYIQAFASPESREKYPEVSIYFAPYNPADINEIVDLIDSEIEKQLEIGLSAKRAQDFVGRYKAWSVMKSEDADAECNTIGRNMVNYGVPFTLKDDIEVYETISTNDMEQALRDYVLPKNRMVYCAVPNGATELVEGKNDAVAHKGEFNRVIDSKNVSLMIKENHSKPIIDVVINLSVSSDFENAKTQNRFDAVAEMLMSGSKNYDALDLTEWFENHLTYPEVVVFPRGLQISFKCLKDDYTAIQDIIIDALNNPSFDENEIEMYRQGLRSELQRLPSNAGANHRDFRNSVLYPGTKNGIAREDVLKDRIAMEKKDYEHIFKKYFHGEKIIAVYVGDITEDEAKQYVNTLSSGLNMKKVKGKKTKLSIPDLDGVYENPYNFEQVNVDVNFKAPLRTDKDYFAYYVMTQLLTGSTGRLHEATRGVKDLAYFAHASYSATPDYGFMRITSQTSVDKKDELVRVVNEELDKLQNELVTKEEIELTIDEYEMQIASMITDENIAGFIMSKEIYDQRFEDRDKEVARFKSVTPEEVKAVAKKYLNNRAVFVSFPNDDVKKLVD